MHIKSLTCLILLSFSVVFQQACKSKSGHPEAPVQTTETVKEAPKPELTSTEKPPAENTTPKNKTEAPPSSPKAQTDTLVRYWVSFYSIGGGVDVQSANSFFNWLDGEKAAGIIDFEKFRWGREGEVDACISLLQNTAEAKEAWISKAQARLSKAEHVHQKRNGTCKSRR